MKNSKIILNTLLSLVMVLSLVSSFGIPTFAANYAPMGVEGDLAQPALLTAPETCDTNSCVLLRLERESFADNYTATSVDFYRGTENDYTGKKIASGTAECFPDSGLEPGVYYYYAAVDYSFPGGGSHGFLTEIKKVTVTMGDSMLGIIDNLAELSVPTCGLVGKALPLQIVRAPSMADECTISNITYYRNTVNNHNGTQLSSGTALSYSDTVSVPGTYYYYAAVSYKASAESSGEFYTGIVAVTVNENKTAAGAPIITAQPASLTAKPGDTVTFKVEAKGDNLHYKWWYVDGGVPMEFNSDSPTISIKTEDMSWSGFSFWCEVSNAAGSVTSEQARLTLSNNPQSSVPDPSTSQTDGEQQSVVKILSQPVDASVKDGEEAVFSCKAEGNVKYQWWRTENTTFRTDDPSAAMLSDATGLKGTATDTLTVTAGESVNGKYFVCEINGENGEKVYSNTAKLSVTDLGTDDTLTTERDEKGLGTVGIVLISVSAVLLFGAAAAAIVLFVKSKKKK